MHNAVCVNVECNLNLRNTSACGKNTVKVEHAECFVVFCEFSFALKNMNFNGGLIVGCR